jgi:hypothetical protein
MANFPFWARVDVRFTPSLVPVVHRSISKDFSVRNIAAQLCAQGALGHRHGTCGVTALCLGGKQLGVPSQTLGAVWRDLPLRWLGYFILLDHWG